MAGGGMIVRMHDSQNESLPFVLGVFGPVIGGMR
jgi:hypothetical protein